MSTKLHLAAMDDLDRVLSMVAAYHAETGVSRDAQQRAAAIAPLLDGSPHGAIYVLGPRRSPVGYIAISFGWSIEMGGIDGHVDEFWVRPAVRGRGMGREALAAIVLALRDAGVKALHMEVERESKAADLYRRMGFAKRDHSCLMTARLTGRKPAQAAAV